MNFVQGLLPLGPVPNPFRYPGRTSNYRCQCGCVFVALDRLVRLGKVRSCGCYKARLMRGNTYNLRHGHSYKNAYPTPTYITWQAMKRRCQAPHAANYFRYGGRGIRVCRRWQKFENFLSDMGERPSGTSIDRINPDGHYTKRNCRWSTPRVQVANRRKRCN